MFDYLLHEHKKKKTRIEAFNKNIYQTNNLAYEFIESNRPKMYLQSLSKQELWKLFHLISFKVYGKELWNCVCLPNFKWTKLKISPYECVLETPVGWIKKELGNNMLYFSDVISFAKSNPSLLINSTNNYDIESSEKKDTDPLIGRKENNFYKIHDGNGRLERILALNILSKIEIPKIESYIGIATDSITYEQKNKILDFLNS